jgi:hypothetical protein
LGSEPWTDPRTCGAGPSLGGGTLKGAFEGGAADGGAAAGDAGGGTNPSGLHPAGGALTIPGGGTGICPVGNTKAGVGGTGNGPAEEEEAAEG